MKLTLLFFAICLLSVSCTSQPKFTSETVLADSIVGQPGIDGAAGKNGINCWEALFRDINEDGVIDDTEKLWDEDGDGFADADVNQDGDVNFLDCLGRPGEDGRDGLNGLNGTNGINGAQGPQGPAGPAGPQGPSGPQGPQGLKGDPGDQGPIGLTGPTGSRGLGCNVSTLPPSSQYPAGGAQINCEDNSSAIVTNGSNAPQEWKLVASGSNYTEGARYTMTAAGLITTKLMHPFGNQHVSTTVLNWPNSSVTQLRFLVRNLGDEFCVGGNGVLQLTPSDPAPSYANCTNYAYTADSNAVPILNASARSHGTWTRLSINGNPRNKCTNSMQNSPVSGYPGMYGYANYWAVECLYSGGASGGDWQNAITSLIVEEADYSPGVAVWQWEIWAR